MLINQPVGATPRSSMRQKLKMFVWYLLGAGVVRSVISFSDTDAFISKTDLFFAIFPFAVILALAVHSFWKYRSLGIDDPFLLVLRGKELRVETLRAMLVLLGLTLISYIVSTPAAFLGAAGTISDFFVTLLVNPDQLFIVLSYLIGGLILFGFLVIFTAFIAERAGHSFAISYTTLRRRILYTMFWLIFWMFGLSFAAFPQAYAPLTMYAVDSIMPLLGTSSTEDTASLANSLRSSLKSIRQEVAKTANTPQDKPLDTSGFASTAEVTDATTTGTQAVSLAEALKKTISNLKQDVSSTNNDLADSVDETKTELNQNIQTATGNLSNSITTELQTKLDSTGGKITGALAIKGTLDVLDILTARNILPESDNTYDIGSSSKYWKTLYVKTIHMLDALVSGNLTVVGDVFLPHLSANRLLATNGSNATVSTSLGSWLIGTSGQVNVTGNSDGTATLALPQSIATTSSPTFAGATLTSGLGVTGNSTIAGTLSSLTGLSSSGTITFSSFTSNGGPLYTNASGVLAQAPAGTSTQVLHGGATPSFSALSLTADVSGTLPIGNGGTNGNATPSAGALAYGTGTAYAFTAVGTSGRALISGGAGAPTWFAPTAGSILYAGANGILAQDNATFFWDTTNKRLGIGTATPTTAMELYSSAAADNILTLTSATATNDPLIKWKTGASPVIQFTTGVDTSDSNTFKISNGDGLSTGAAPFSINSSGVTAISALSMGAMSFEADAGIITWIDMPVTSTATVGLVESYTASLDGNPALTVYGTSDGTGSIANLGVGIGTTTPLTKLTVLDTSTASPRGILSMQISDDTNGARVGFAKARGTVTTPTTLLTGDIIGRDMFRGYDGTNYLEMASLEVGVSGTVGTNRIPTYMAFSTATDASPSVLTERMRILNSGNVGIGTTTPSALLSVGATSQFQVNTTGAIAAATGVTSSGTITLSGLVSCGGLQSNGSGVLSCTSDSRLKDIQSPFSSGLDAVMKINPQTYIWKTDSGLYDGGIPYSGFVAQNIAEALPMASGVGAGGYLQINTTTILAATVNAIKEQQGTIIQNSMDLVGLSLKADTNTVTLTGLNADFTQAMVKTDDKLTILENRITALEALTGTTPIIESALPIIPIVLPTPPDAPLPTDTPEVTLLTLDTSLKVVTDRLTFLETANQALLAFFANANLDLNNIPIIANNTLSLEVVDVSVKNLTAADTIKAKSVETEAIKTDTFSVNNTDPDMKTVGTATISAGDIDVTVATKAVTIESRVFVTPETPAVLGVKKDAGNTGFTVSLPEITAQDTPFSWWILEENPPKP